MNYLIAILPPKESYKLSLLRHGKLTLRNLMMTDKFYRIFCKSCELQICLFWLDAGVEVARRHCLFGCFDKNRDMLVFCLHLVKHEGKTTYHLTT